MSGNTMEENASVCKAVPDDSTRLDVQKVLEMVPHLGLVIDLTNTKKYYNPEDFRERGVEHIKIMCPGHKVPTLGLRRQFRDVIKNFLENNIDNDKLIGVHCTHGVNRTGYLICDYMVSDLCIMPQDAIQRFKDARGHPIERINYITSLGMRVPIHSDRQPINPDHKTTYRDHQPTYRYHRPGRRSCNKSFTNNPSPTTVYNWRCPNYIHQRNLTHTSSSNTSEYRNWRDGPIESNSEYRFNRTRLPDIRERTITSDRNNASGKISSRYQVNRMSYPEKRTRYSTSNPNDVSGNIRNTHIRFDIGP